MKCPVCAVDLKMSERQGIEIDYCPKCRGVWLDRGELDKLIERNTRLELYDDTDSMPAVPSAPRYHDAPKPKRKNDDHYYEDDRYYNDKRYRDYDDGDYRRRKRRKSVFEEIFDIFD